jgi:hypothetical protein
VTSPATAALRGVYAGSVTQAWAVGDGGTLIRWDGSAWTPATSGTTQALNGIWGASSAEVWAVGNAGTILRWRQ